MDVRTPSPHDAIYRDRWHTYDGGSSLLVYGTQRFVAGSNLSPSIRLFDFRYPKSYHHTDALPCSIETPRPEPPFERRGKLAGEEVHGRCDVQPRTTCNWHQSSRLDAYRPDATVIIGNEKHDRVYAMAKASDMSDTFYCGLQGTVVEIKLKLTEDVEEQDLQRPAPPGWRTSGSRKSAAALIETGVSLCREGEWTMEAQGVPPIRGQQKDKYNTVFKDSKISSGNRLDSIYYKT